MEEDLVIRLMSLVLELSQNVAVISKLKLNNLCLELDDLIDNSILFPMMVGQLKYFDIAREILLYFL